MLTAAEFSSGVWCEGGKSICFMGLWGQPLITLQAIKFPTCINQLCQLWRCVNQVTLSGDQHICMSWILDIFSASKTGVDFYADHLAGKAKAGMVHSVSGCTWGVQVKLWDPLRMRAIPECLRGVFTTRRYTNTHLPLPLPYMWDIW